jgi:hypothetical protein
LRDGRYDIRLNRSLLPWSAADFALQAAAGGIEGLLESRHMGGPRADVETRADEIAPDGLGPSAEVARKK